MTVAECRENLQKDNMSKLVTSFETTGVWYMDPPEQQQQKKDPCSRFLWVIGDGINQKCKEVIGENALNRSYSVDDESLLLLQGFATKIES